LLLSSSVARAGIQAVKRTLRAKREVFMLVILNADTGLVNLFVLESAV
jgi:hypothetical protein